MTRTKHSPEPWSVDTAESEMTYGDGGPDAITGMVTTYRVVDSKGRLVADTAEAEVALIEEEHDEEGVSAWDTQGEANSRLLAAAPDLLAACTYITRNARLIQRGMLAGQVEIRLSSEQHAAVINAIAKAEGRPA